MRTLDSTFTTEKNKPANHPIRLYTITDYDGTNDLYFAEHDADVVYDSVTYVKFPITLDEISENNKGTIDSVRVTVSNASRLIQSYLEDYDLRGKKVTITTVFADQLADTGAHIDDVFWIDSYTADQHTVSFTLTSKFDVLDIALPGRQYSRNYCGWKFKSTECGYSGGQTSCNKTKQRCKELVNYSRFGGFPSINPSRVALG